MVVENNYGYTGPTVDEQGKTTTPGLARVDLTRGGRGCRVASGTRDEVAPSVVPKLALGAGPRLHVHQGHGFATTRGT